MSELKTEEEQIEAFKNWWKKNGTALIIAVAVAVGGYFGFQAWQTSEANHVAEASDLYQNLVQASADLNNEDNQKTLSFIAQQLKDDYSDTGYAMFAQLFVARLEAEQGHYNEAVKALNSAIEQTDDESFHAIAQLRIAQVLLQQEKYDESLAQLEKVTAADFSAQKQELMGDVYLQQGKREQAREAYQAAKNALVGGTNHPLLDIKLQDLVKG